jgi:hypothetical protein
MGQLGQLITPSIYNSVHQGMQDGQQQATQGILSRNTQAAFNGDQGALAKIYSASPQAGMQVQQQGVNYQGQLQKASGEKLQQMGRYARMVSAAAKSGNMDMAQQLYASQLAPISKEVLGHDVPPFTPDMVDKLDGIGNTFDPPGQKESFTLGAGQTRYGADGKVLASAPAAEPKEPDAIRELRLLQQNPELLRTKTQLAAAGRAPAAEGGKASDWQVIQQQDGSLVRVNKLSGEVAPVTLSGKPVAGKSSAQGGQVVQNPDGSTTIIPGGKPNTQELNNVGFYSRMVQADGELDGITGKGYDPTNIKDNATVGRTLTNWLASSDGQQYHQAAMNWIRANLRKESGAAIGKEEAAQEYANYFPQVGDSKDVIAQKSRNRKVVEEAMRTATGPALGRQAPPKQAATTNEADPLGIL